VSGRTTFTVGVDFTIEMDDTSVAEAQETVAARVNEMLAALERKDDVRIVLLHRVEVKEQP
jgi:hypothetical protein